MQLTKQMQKIWNNYGCDILTGLGSAGVILTAASSAYAAYKSILELSNDEIHKTSIKTKAKIIIKNYIPTAILAGSSMACIIGANKLSRKKQAALMSAYILSETALSDLRNRCGNDIRAEIAKDNYSEDSIIEAEPISQYGNKLLFYEEFSGRYFRSTYEHVELAEKKLSDKLADTGYASLNDYYNFLGINETANGNIMGWSDTDVMHYGVDPIHFEYLPIWELPGTDIAANNEVQMIIFPWPPIIGYEDI